MSNSSEEPALQLETCLITAFCSNVSTLNCEVGKHDSKPHPKVAFRKYTWLFCQTVGNIEDYLHIFLNEFIYQRGHILW